MCAVLLIYCDISFILCIIIEMKKHLLVLMMATIVFLLVKTQTTSKPKYAPDHMFQVCGKHLAALLSFVCESKYNTPKPGRVHRRVRSADIQPSDFEEEPAVTELPQAISTTTPPEEVRSVLSFILPREEARSLLSFRRRRKRGVFDECCKKACSYKELRYYCAT